MLRLWITNWAWLFPYFWILAHYWAPRVVTYTHLYSPAFQGEYRMRTRQRAVFPLDRDVTLRDARLGICITRTFDERGAGQKHGIVP
jgi:hypothetical protein